MSKTKTVSEILVDVLTEAGVSNCYGIIGDTLNFVGKAIEKVVLIGCIHVTKKQLPLLPALKL